MSIIYCLNVCYNKEKLINNINIINKAFNTPKIFVSSNGIVLEDTPPNVHFNKWGENQGWQLGALNTTLQSLSMAANENSDVIFSHDDIYPINKNKICHLMNYLNDYDIVCRKYVGPHEQPHIYPYLMIEDILISKRVIKLFENIQIFDELPFKCAEMSFGKIVTEMNLNVKTIDIDNNCDCTENEMGFYHDHKH